MVESIIFQNFTEAVTRNGNIGRRKRNAAGHFDFLINNTGEKTLGCVPLGESGSGFLICGVPFEEIHLQISDLSNPRWTRIHQITDLRDLKINHFPQRCSI